MKLRRVYGVYFISLNSETIFERMQNFSIRLGNTSDVNEHTRCAYHKDVVEEVVTLDCHMVGRFVSFRKEEGDEINKVTICEIVVIGHLLRTNGEHA